MFQPGESVVYGIHGVCRVVDQEARRVDGRQVTYLVLAPVADTESRYYVPTHNALAMAKVSAMLTREELEGLLDSCEIREDCWIREENQRKQTYRELISSGDRKKLLAMVCTLYRHKAEQTAAGRKVHLCDDNFLRDAERLLAGEVAAVMEIEGNEAKRYIREKLKNV